MSDLVVYLEGIGWWSPGSADWAAAATRLRQSGALPCSGDGRPTAGILPPNERRRAPELVRVACDVAAQACAMAARDAARLPCVFASAYGDLAIVDAICTTLADDPRELSPTQFHNSVHNAPVGYWTVATRCHAASTALSAWRASFAAGLLEAAAEVRADSMPVLFVAGDMTARGPLAEVVRSPVAFGAALVLAPERGPRTLAALRLRQEGEDAAPAIAASDLLANTLPLFAALACAQPARLRLRSGAAGVLAIEIEITA